MNNTPTDLIKPATAAKLVGVTASTIYKWINNCKVRGYKKGRGQVFVSQAEIEVLNRLTPVAEERRMTRGEELLAAERAKQQLGRLGYGT